MNDNEVGDNDNILLTEGMAVRDRLKQILTRKIVQFVGRTTLPIDLNIIKYTIYNI